jgi:hypothetical protein
VETYKGVWSSGRHCYVVAGVGINDGAVFAVEAQRALGHEEGFVVHFVPLLQWLDGRGFWGMNWVLAEWDGGGEGQNVLLSIDPDQRKTGSSSYMWWWARSSGRDGEFGGADAVV